MTDLSLYNEQVDPTMRDIRFRQALSHFWVNDSATSFPNKKINVLFSKQSFSKGT